MENNHYHSDRLTVGKPVAISPVSLRYCHVTSLSKPSPILGRIDDLKISSIYYRPDVSLSKKLKGHSKKTYNVRSLIEERRIPLRKKCILPQRHVSE